MIPPGPARSARFFNFPLVLLALASLLCTRIPLLNYLGFEFSAFAALLGGFLAGLATISLWTRRDFLIVREEGERPDVDEELWRFLKSLTASLALFCIVPAAIISANALFVKNCSFGEGLFLYLLGVVPGVLFCSMAALLIAVLVDYGRRTLFVLVYCMLLAYSTFTTVVRPQIFAFNPILGFFPGITYDETLQFEGRLVLYRCITLAASILFFLAAVALFRRKVRAQFHLRRFRVLHGSELFAGIVLTLVVVGAFFWSNDLGFSSTESSLELQLGGRLETQHFIISYPHENVNESQARQIGLVHEFAFASVVQELRVFPYRKIHSFLYSSAEQKGVLMGAARTNISKPWLSQIHINMEDVEVTLKHEMVHVLAAEFGYPVFRVAPNPGLIEGLATAVERVQYDESIHRVAAQIITVGIDPDMQNLFSFSGFAQAHPAISYSLAGSFCRYLIDNYGLRRFKRLYAGGNFHDIYNQDAAPLFTEWRKFLGRYRVDTNEQQKAAYLFRRPSIFGKECARVIANLNAQTRRLYDDGQYNLALASANRSLELTRTPEAIVLRMNTLLKLRQFQDATEFGEESLSDSTIAHAVLPLKLQLGDSYWALGDQRSAAASYQELLRTHLGLNTDEACLLRLEVLRDTLLAHTLRPYFTAQLVDTSRIPFLQASLRLGGKSILKSYLLAREYATRGNERRAVEVLEPLEKMSSDLLELQRQLRLARLHFSLGEFQRAKINFWQAQNYTSSEALQLRIREWLDRCDWLANPPPSLFPHKPGEVLSYGDENDSCNCSPRRVGFSIAMSN
jgi:tetratricopeptide (TPR) repeat protein